MDYVIKLQVTVRADSLRHVEYVSDYVLEVTADDAKEV
jgi:hypothetical protein